MPILNIQDLPEPEHEFYINWVRYYARLYKALFRKYARINNKKVLMKDG